MKPYLSTHVGPKKYPDNFDDIILHKRISQNIIEGEMLIKTQLTNSLQIFCELMHNSKVILKSIIGPDDTCQGDHHA